MEDTHQPGHEAGFFVGLQPNGLSTTNPGADTTGRRRRRVRKPETAMQQNK
jgi:hypothetical protein